MSSSSPVIKIGTQTITPKIEDKGNQYYMEFEVKITSYKGKPTNETITIKLLCDKYKLVMTLPLQPPQRVEKTPQECVNDWIEAHKNIYTFG